METLMNLTRIKFAGSEPEKKGDPGSSRDQRTQSFKEKKKAQNWLQRQFIRKMSHDYESRDLEHATAVAAAAFAISSQEKKTSEAPERSLTKTRSKPDGTKSPISRPGGSKRFSGSFKFTDGQGKKEPTFPARDEKAIARLPSKKKTSSFRELSKTKSDTTAPEILPPIRQTSSKPATRETEADAWEIAKLEKIRKKYNKLKETIDSWENNKRKKAKRRLNMQESELEQRRLKALDKFRVDMTTIDQVVRGAREQADERQRKEELKAKEKANRIRTTGRLPGTYSCF